MRPTCTARTTFPARVRGRTDLASRANRVRQGCHGLSYAQDDDRRRGVLGSLRDLLGRKRFQAASWSDIMASFERRTGRDLAAFFQYWVAGKGLPEITVQSLSVRRKGSRFEITAELARKDLPIPVELP